MRDDKTYELEEWRPVPGFEDLYEVSNLGRVKALGNGGSGNSKPRMKKARQSTNGYMTTTLCKNGHMYDFRVHRIVASAFLGLDIHNLEIQVNHIDEDKTNNRLSNLELCDEMYNHFYGTGRQRAAEKHSRAVIAVNVTTGERLEFKSAASAARVLVASTGNICKCLKGRIPTAYGYTWHYAS